MLKRWGPWLLLTIVCLGLGVLLVIQLRTERIVQQATQTEEWGYVVADLVDGNARLREEIEALEAQLEGLEAADGGGVVLESLVDEVNHLRITNGLIEVSGPGIVVSIDGPISVLDLHDLINELRNAGAEALTLNDARLVVWTAISTDGEHVTVDGRPLEMPYHLQAIGDPQNLDVALTRPGGLIDLLSRSNRDVTISVEQVIKLTLPVCDQTFQFAYGQPAD